MKRKATISSKNQITIPAEIRAVLGLKAGGVVVFDVDMHSSPPKVALRRHSSLEELAGSVPVPPEVNELSWREIRERAWSVEHPETR
jgi:AbrB family looped-hinge helix DNA binding protein